MALHLELEGGAYLDVRDCEQSEGDKVNRDERSSTVGWRKAWFNSNCPKFFYLFALIPNQSQELSLLKHSSILMYKWHFFFFLSNELCLSLHIPICCQSISICRHPCILLTGSHTPPPQKKQGWWSTMYWLSTLSSVLSYTYKTIILIAICFLKASSMKYF